MSQADHGHAQLLADAVQLSFGLLGQSAGGLVQHCRPVNGPNIKFVKKVKLEPKEALMGLSPLVTTATLQLLPAVFNCTMRRQQPRSRTAVFGSAGGAVGSVTLAWTPTRKGSHALVASGQNSEQPSYWHRIVFLALLLLFAFRWRYGSASVINASKKMRS